jgi:NRPS condensation-like uncharacterized protein
VVIDLAAPIERVELERATREVAERFPVLACRFERRFWRDRWVPAPGPATALETVEPGGSVDQATLEVIRRQIDPASGWPWRVTSIEGFGGARLVITVLHQVADGAGVLAIARELGARLAGLAPEPGATVGDRGLAQVVRALPLRAFPVLAARLAAELARPLQLPFLARTTLRVRAPAPASPCRVFKVLEVPIGETSELRRRCRASGATVNDALVTALALLGVELGRRGWPASYFTVDLRRYLRDDAPRICNLSGVDAVVLERRAARSFDDALAAVVRLTARRKRSLAGLPFILAQAIWCAALPHRVLRVVGALAGRWIGRLLTRGLVVTNIGPMDHALEPWSERATRGLVIGPFLRGVLVPVITATSSRDTLSIVLNGHDDLADGELERVAAHLASSLGARG